MDQCRLRIVVLVVVVLSLLLAGVGGCSSDGNSSSSGNGGLTPTGDPEIDKGLDLVEAKCDLCHTLDRIRNANKDAAEWETTVARMRKNGAVLTDTEAQQIVDYLATR